MKKRIISMMLVICMVLMLVPPSVTVFAEGEDDTSTGKQPSVTAYATKEQLMDDTFAPKSEGTADNIGKLAFGKNSDGMPLQWYILGKDSGVSGDNTIIVAADPIVGNQVFNSYLDNKTYDYYAKTGYGDDGGSIEVSANHYGASELRNVLGDMVADLNTTYFTAAEKGLMNATSVTTYDSKNDNDYTTTDKLYVLAAEDGINSTVLEAGSNNQTVLDMTKYEFSGDTYWLRTPYLSGVLNAEPSNRLNSYGLRSNIDVRPVSNLDLSSVMFASAALGGAGGTINSVMPMTLRFDGLKKAIGTVTYDSTSVYNPTSKIVAHKDANATGTVYLMIQGNNGTEDWFFSIPVEETTVFTLEDVAKNYLGTTDVCFDNCKIWLETKDAEDGLIYAVEAEVSTYLVNLNTNGGTINSGNVSSYTSGQGATLPTDVTRKGYALVGWYDNQELTGDPVKAISATDNGGKTFYAKWEHAHNLTLVAEKPATCTTSGSKAYYTCDGCDAWFKDEAGSVEITNHNSVIINALGHKNKTTVTKATTSSNGKIVKSCTVCNKTLATTVIPKVSSIKLKTTNYIYNGGVKKPAVTVLDAKGNVIPSTHYTVKYASGRKNVGRYKVTVTFKRTSDKYSGSKSTYFYINPKGTTIASTSGASKAFTVKWNKQSTNMASTKITGYQIRYSTSSKMTNAKTQTIKGYKNVSKKVTNLKAKKTYYVQVRTYKSVSGKIYYSSWSKTKTVKTK
ncbi:MAG: InlB B-repeat-containing protein [Coprococcus sp.]